MLRNDTKRNYSLIFLKWIQHNKGYAYPSRDQSRYLCSQWVTSLQCNNISHWLDTHLNWARFLFLAPCKLGLCSANHRPGYWSNLPCDWLSTVWAYSEQETENRPWSLPSSAKDTRAKVHSFIVKALLILLSSPRLPCWSMGSGDTPRLSPSIIIHRCLDQWLLYTFNQDHSGYGLSQWEKMLQCNSVSHWLSLYPEWFLYTTVVVIPMI